MLSRTVSIFPPLHRYLTFISRETHIRGRIDVRTRTKRRQHANAAWKEQMPTLVDGYLAWRHEAPTDEDNTIASNMFHVDVVGISGKVSFLQYMALTYTQSHSKILHVPSPSSSVLMNQRMQPSFAWDFWGAPHYGRLSLFASNASNYITKYDDVNPRLVSKRSRRFCAHFMM
jgi:hypothetical protein